MDFKAPLKCATIMEPAEKSREVLCAPHSELLGKKKTVHAVEQIVFGWQCQVN